MLSEGKGFLIRLTVSHENILENSKTSPSFVFNGKICGVFRKWMPKDVPNIIFTPIWWLQHNLIQLLEVFQSVWNTFIYLFDKSYGKS